MYENLRDYPIPIDYRKALGAMLGHWLQDGNRLAITTFNERHDEIKDWLALPIEQGGVGLGMAQTDQIKIYNRDSYKTITGKGGVPKSKLPLYEAAIDDANTLHNQLFGSSLYHQVIMVDDSPENLRCSEKLNATCIHTVFINAEDAFLGELGDTQLRGLKQANDHIALSKREFDIDRFMHKLRFSFSSSSRYSTRQESAIPDAVTAYITAFIDPSAGAATKLSGVDTKVHYIGPAIDTDMLMRITPSLLQTCKAAEMLGKEPADYMREIGYESTTTAKPTLFRKAANFLGL